MINLFFISIFFIFGSLLYCFPASLGHSSHRSKQHRRRYKNIYSLKKIAFFYMKKIEIVEQSRLDHTDKYNIHIFILSYT